MYLILTQSCSCALFFLPHLLSGAHGWLLNIKVGKYSHDIPLFENSRAYGDNVLDVKRSYNFFIQLLFEKNLSGEYQREMCRKNASLHINLPSNSTDLN
jgi:hypothetical protein